MPNRSAVMNLRRIRIISRYCIHKLAVRSFANVSTWPSRMVWILAMASSFATSSALLSWPSARHRATRQLSDLSWYTVSCLMIRRRLAQLRLLVEVGHPSIWTVAVRWEPHPTGGVHEPLSRSPFLTWVTPRLLVHISSQTVPWFQNQPLDDQCYQGSSFTRGKHLISVLGVVSDYLLAVTVVWLTISTTVAVQYLGASNMHVFRCIYCEDLR